MSQLAAQLDELGFDSVEEAEANGYLLDATGTLCPSIDQAHEDWEKERDELVAELKKLSEDNDIWNAARTTLDHAIDFIKRSSL